MTFEQIEALVRAAEGRGLAVLEYAAAGASLLVTFDAVDQGVGEIGAQPTEAAAPAAPLPPTRTDPRAAVVSPGVGFFRTTHPSGAILPGRGDRVAAGAVLAFIQAGPVLLPVAAARNGVLGAALVADGAAVDYGARLFELD